jgi:hypothetical protein
MPATDEFELDPQTHERIRARSLERGSRLRRRATVVRRSVTVMALLALAGGAVAIAEATHGIPASQQKVHISGSSSTTSTTVPATSVPPATSTTVQHSTSTTVAGGRSTSSTTVQSSSTTTSVTTTTTTTVPAGHSFSHTLSDVAPAGTLQSASWTVPAGNTVEITTVTLARTSSPALGTARLQVLSGGASPETLVAVSLHQLSSRAVTFTLATPVVLPATRVLDLSVSCDVNQAACVSGVTVAGDEVPVANLRTGDFFDGLPVVVTPGTTGAASWAVPANDVFSISDLVVSAVSPGMRGTLAVGVGTSPSSTRTIYTATLATLGANLAHEQPSVSLHAGESLYVMVTCGASQAACSDNVLFTGALGG